MCRAGGIFGVGDCLFFMEGLGGMLGGGSTAREEVEKREGKIWEWGNMARKREVKRWGKGRVTVNPPL